MTPKKIPKPLPIEFTGSQLHWMQGAVRGIRAARCGDPVAWTLAVRLATILDESLDGLPSFQAIPVVEVPDS